MARDVFELVKLDLDIRNKETTQRFGQPLTVASDAGDHMMVRAYKEVLDLALYLRKEITRKNLMP